MILLQFLFNLKIKLLVMTTSGPLAFTHIKIYQQKQPATVTSGFKSSLLVKLDDKQVALWDTAYCTHYAYYIVYCRNIFRHLNLYNHYFIKYVNSS